MDTECAQNVPSQFLNWQNKLRTSHCVACRIKAPRAIWAARTNCGWAGVVAAGWVGERLTAVGHPICRIAAVAESHMPQP